MDIFVYAYIYIYIHIHIYIYVHIYVYVILTSPPTSHVRAGVRRRRQDRVVHQRRVQPQAQHPEP